MEHQILLEIFRLAKSENIHESQITSEFRLAGGIDGFEVKFYKNVGNEKTFIKNFTLKNIFWQERFVDYLAEQINELEKEKINLPENIKKNISDIEKIDNLTADDIVKINELKNDLKHFNEVSLPIMQSFIDSYKNHLLLMADDNQIDWVEMKREFQNLAKKAKELRKSKRLMSDEKHNLKHVISMFEPVPVIDTINDTYKVFSYRYCKNIIEMIENRLNFKK